MEPADVERLLSMSPSWLDDLRRTVRAAGLDSRFVAKLARVGERLDDPLRAPMRAWHARRLPESAAVLARLFVLHDPVSAADAARALGNARALVDVGLLDETASGITSRARLAFAGDLLVFGDRDSARYGVPPLNGVTAALARAALPTEPGRRFGACLDLGCGAGALALALAATADTVVATDLNPRALAWTRFNARLNGVENIEVREGDLFEPARGQRFDRIVSQPPFIALRADEEPSVFVHGGRRGDELALRVVAGAASHLTARGRALVLADWPLFDAEALDVRVRAAAESSAPAIFVFASPGKNLDEYCTSIAAGQHPQLDDAFTAAALAQRDHFEGIGARGVAQALVVVEAGGPAQTLLLPVRHAHDAPVTRDDVDRLVAAYALVTSPDSALLSARLRLPEGARLVDQPAVHGAPGAVIVQLPPGRPGWPVVVSTDAAAMLRAIEQAPTVLDAARAYAAREGAGLETVTDAFARAAREALARGALETT